MKIKPCPFCGSDKVRVIGNDYFMRVACDACNVAGPLIMLYDIKPTRIIMTKKEGKEKAIEKWNKRVADEILELISKRTKGEASAKRIWRVGR
ncbi:MAG: Lar family restriction alleviation protein [Clostridiales bacterium]|jgi:Lar family restriction alleviation protein|nr:Lar family restriction alleviation protein [Clostridiales bacterium]